MNFGISLEIVGIVLSLVGGFCASLAWSWKFLVKPTMKLYKNQQILVSSVEDIKKELTTNGGSSIKDTVNRIDRRQIMLDKRSKAIFYNVEKAILEVDEKGNILWANDVSQADGYEEFKRIRLGFIHRRTSKRKFFKRI